MKTGLMFLCLWVLSIHSKEPCSTDLLLVKNLRNSPEIQDKINAIEHYTNNYIRNRKGKPSLDPVYIPIVVHVLYYSDILDISDQHILSQIPILNADFSKTNSNFSLTPDPFREMAGTVDIQFCLAAVDPSGNNTNGITRHLVNPNFEVGSNYYNEEYGGAKAWDTEQYLNIWLADLTEDDLLGFATPPGTASPIKDGVVVNTYAWGDQGIATGNYPNNLGRTATHEVGHYLNLSHVWGRNKGGCEEDDNVEDTPLQDQATYGCPSFPKTDNCSGGDGINFSNYMDYTDDRCMTMFTQGQKLRMEAALNGPRASLLNSGHLCDSLGVSALQTKQSFEPTVELSLVNHSLHLDMSADGFKKKTLKIVGLSGKTQLETSFYESSQRIDLGNFDPGLYVVQIIGTHNNKSFVKKIFIP